MQKKFCLSYVSNNRTYLLFEIGLFLSYDVCAFIWQTKNTSIRLIENHSQIQHTQTNKKKKKDAIHVIKPLCEKICNIIIHKMQKMIW